MLYWDLPLSFQSYLQCYRHIPFLYDQLHLSVRLRDLEFYFLGNWNRKNRHKQYKVVLRCSCSKKNTFSKWNWTLRRNLLISWSVLCFMQYFAPCNPNLKRAFSLLLKTHDYSQTYLKCRSLKFLPAKWLCSNTACKWIRSTSESFILWNWRIISILIKYLTVIYG